MKNEKLYFKYWFKFEHTIYFFNVFQNCEYHTFKNANK